MIDANIIEHITNDAQDARISPDLYYSAVWENMNVEEGQKREHKLTINLCRKNVWAACIFFFDEGAVGVPFQNIKNEYYVLYVPQSTTILINKDTEKAFKVLDLSSISDNFQACLITNIFSSIGGEITPEQAGVIEATLKHEFDIEYHTHQRAELVAYVLQPCHEYYDAVIERHKLNCGVESNKEIIKSVKGLQKI